MLLRLGFASPQVPVNLASFQCRQVGVAPVSSTVDAAGHPGAFRRGGGDWQRRNQKLRRGGAVRSDDAVGITLSPASLTVNEESGASHTAVLNAQPSGDVTVTIAGHSGTGISINPATPLAFTSSNWNTAQRVTVSAADDTDTNNEVTLLHTAAGATECASVMANLKVAVDDYGLPTGVLTVSPATVPEVGATLTADPSRHLRRRRPHESDFQLPVGMCERRQR